MAIRGRIFWFVLALCSKPSEVGISFFHYVFYVLVFISWFDRRNVVVEMIEHGRDKQVNPGGTGTTFSLVPAPT